MRNKLLIVLIFIVGIITFILLENKTFIKSYYELKNLNSEVVKIPLSKYSFYLDKNGTTVTFNTLKGIKTVSNDINKYIDSLQSCYDESYFYDKDADLTIKSYRVEDKFPFNIIYLEYDLNNLCKDEFVLEDNWYDNIKNNNNISEIKINKCVFENNTLKCYTKDINKSVIEEFYNTVNFDKIERIDNNKNISINETEDYYYIAAYYDLNKNNYVLESFKYNNYLAFKITDQNDHSKNAIYKVDFDIDKLFKQLYDIL